MPLPSGAYTRSNRNQLEAASREGGGDRSVILSLQNISTETQAQSRLAVLRRELCGSPRSPQASQASRQVQSHWAYGPSSSPVFGPIFGGTTGKPGGRMPAAPLFTFSCDRLDSRVNAKQEGSP